MSTHHLLRIGAMGHVGRFAAIDAVRYPRRSRVVVRTVRGLELGEVLAPCDATPDGNTDGSILRGVTPQDELLCERLEKNRHDAYKACVAMLAERGLSAVLMDVEHLFDGQSLYFYFLGDVPDEVESLTAELAEAYEAQAQFRKFTETLTQGCGPDCGTEKADGGGCDLCAASCAVGGSCGSKRA